MAALLAVLAFGLALVLHLLRQDPFVVTAFMLGGLFLLALEVLYPWAPWVRRSGVRRT